MVNNRKYSRLETMHEESMLVERCGLSETGTLKSLALGLSWATKSNHPVRPGATSAIKINPKSNQNQPESIQNQFKIDLGGSGRPPIDSGAPQEEVGTRPERPRTRSGRTKSTLGTTRGAPRQPKNIPAALPRRSRGSPGATQDARQVRSCC